MARVAVIEDARLDIEHAEEASDEHARVITREDEVVHFAKNLGWFQAKLEGSTERGDGLHHEHGGGDAFASGLIYAMLHDEKPLDILNFAVASSVIKHTIHGDANITDDAKTIKALMNQSYDIKR